MYISSHSTKEKNPATTKLEMKRKTTIDRGKVFPHFSRALFTVFSCVLCLFCERIRHFDMPRLVLAPWNDDDENCYDEDDDDIGEDT